MRWLNRLREEWRRLSRRDPRDRAELVDVLRDASRRGVLDADALAMIEGVLDVADLQVRDIMVPRSRMIVLERAAAPDESLRLVVESGHSRFPVIGDDRDQVAGILLAKDLLRGYAQGRPGPLAIADYLRPASFVPESKRLNVLLKEFRASRRHMAIVVDEYGGVSGLVTIEDVIEEIVGEIADEYDVVEDQTIRREGERQFTVLAATPVAEFNDYFATHFSEEQYDTIGGLVMHEFGRLPRRGESVLLDSHEFRVLRADRRRIDQLRVTTPAPVPMHAGEAGSG
ncbi:MAG: CBS domain-containing protein [Gammaproteobacteria bacterium]|nr:CBS domain-containing protein [Gammaproteobacteria bacterium]